MARRKRSSKKTTSHRRRRVSGVALNAKSPLLQYGSIAAGYFLGDKVNDLLSKITGTLDPKIVAAAEVVAGYLIKSKMKGAAGTVAGGVLMGAGAKKGLQAFGVVAGLPVVNGYRDLKTINGLPGIVKGVPGLSPSMSVISGVDSYSSYTDRD
jgi:hypothetical protein